MTLNNYNTMKKIALALIAATMLLGSCGNKTEAEKTDQISTSGQYTCPMHPEVVSDKPGTCSKCGMDLVKKEGDGKAANDTTMKM